MMKSSQNERCRLLDNALTYLAEDELRYLLQIATAEPISDLSVFRWEATSTRHERENLELVFIHPN